VSSVEIRPVRPDEFEPLGLLTVEAYRDIGATDEGEYEQELLDVAGRAAECLVLVAVDDSGPACSLLGGVTYVPGAGTAMSEFLDDDAAGIRMLAVSPAAQGRGVGRALTQACVEQARQEGRRRVVLHSIPPMTRAQGLYRQMGFARSEERDVFFAEPPWSEEAPLHLMAYVLTL
jgi:ribosomal protein S18 acetylase RimI-like enzyme